MKCSNLTATIQTAKTFWKVLVSLFSDNIAWSSARSPCLINFNELNYTQISSDIEDKRLKKTDF